MNDVGQPGKRCEDQRLVTGHGACMDDRTRPGVVVVLTRAGITGVRQESPTRAMVGERAVDERCAPEHLLLATDNGCDVGEAVAMVVAHRPLSLGKLYATIGGHAQARSALSTAIALYRPMDMTFWLPQAEAALAQVEGR